mmetsp:Transcript_55759/g.81984  ORF Transcript_55759/g.81984 Transcript_55759/m.81984 type:complete len:228 (-) Transcript_55759:930-1613(-)
MMANAMLMPTSRSSTARGWLRCCSCTWGPPSSLIIGCTEHCICTRCMPTTTRTTTLRSYQRPSQGLFTRSWSTSCIPSTLRYLSLGRGWREARRLLCSTFTCWALISSTSWATATLSSFPSGPSNTSRASSTSSTHPPSTHSTTLRCTPISVFSCRSMTGCTARSTPTRGRSSRRPALAWLCRTKLPTQSFWRTARSSFPCSTCPLCRAPLPHILSRRTGSCIACGP